MTLSTLRILRLVALLSLLFGLVFWSASCACGVTILPRSGSGGGGPGEGKEPKVTKKEDPPKQKSVKPYKYQIRGVALLEFYAEPNQAFVMDPSKGSLGGYVVFYSEPQETVITAWSMKDGECKSSLTSYDKKRDAAKVYGLDAGKIVHASIKGNKWSFEKRADKKDGLKEPDVIYNLPTIQEFVFPYSETTTFAIGGGSVVKKFERTLPAPAFLKVLTPELKSDGVEIHRERGLEIQWESKGNLPYLFVRLNQNDDKKRQARSLFCRFANSGRAKIPAADLKPFLKDPDGTHSYLFFFSTTYHLPKIPDFKEPLLAVVRATTTVTAKMK